ncbi:MAG: zinc-binding alcohol dehydrogenase [Chloroflexota bacterium]|nr:zinc-binding alcohol dehydrogenase [Chloroflexota bacterium]
MPEAVWFPVARRVEIRNEPRAVLGARDVRVRALVSGLSAGSELLVYRGHVPPELKPDLQTIGGNFSFPVKFGYASVGRIAEVGADVDEPAVGDVVFVLHPHQSEYVVPAEATLPLPAELTPEIGVFTANVETALTVVLDAHPRLGEAVLVVGQGVVGLLVTMLLRQAGARPIIAVDPLAARREAATVAGADHVLVPDENLDQRVSDLTGGRGVDVAVEVSGNPAALQGCVDAVAFAGTVVVASWYGTRQAALALGGDFHRKRMRLLSSQVSTLDPSVSGRWDRARRSKAVIDLLCQLPLAPLVTHRFPFREAATAYELLDRKPEECLQVVLTYV